MPLLGIETSCDETSVAVIDHDGRVRSNEIASQIARHQPFGGVVPEIASREHLLSFIPVLERSLADAGVKLGDIEGIGVTAGPGLIGALLVGVAAAQGIGYGLGIPLVAVNHLEGHLFSPWLVSGGPAIPRPRRFWSLVVSGGHSSVYEVEHGETPRIRTLNRTRDDAAGEVFDKVGKFLGLPYPGGPHVERLAISGDPERYRFAIAQFKDDSVDFSFSGLKSTAIRVARKEGLANVGEEPDKLQQLSDFCASFQRAIRDQIIDRLGKLWSIRQAPPDELAFAGGVAANRVLREAVSAWGDERSLKVRLAEKSYCTDNGAMIGFAAIQRWSESSTDVTRIAAKSRMPLP